jgi:superfamily II helicase
MIIIKQRKDDDCCVVHGVIHKDARHYELCDYCLFHKYWMYPRTVYYRHGFAKKDVLICDDCNKIEREFYEPRLTTLVTKHNHLVVCNYCRQLISHKSNKACYTFWTQNFFIAQTHKMRLQQ